MDEPGWSFEIPTDVFFGMVIAILILVAVAIVVAFLMRLIRTWQPEHQQRAVDDLSRKMNLVVPEHVREPLARAVAVRKRGAEIGSILSFAIFFLVVQPWSTPTPEIGTTGMVVAIALVLAGTSLGAVIGGLFARRTATTHHRAARLTPLKFSDLIVPLERRILVATLISGVAFRQSWPWR